MVAKATRSRCAQSKLSNEKSLPDGKHFSWRTLTLEIWNYFLETADEVTVLARSRA